MGMFSSRFLIQTCKTHGMYTSQLRGTVSSVDMNHALFYRLIAGGRERLPLLLEMRMD
ncbi:hypothetical protein DPMN_177487 [Dreissena polymorpha]|uniref:Uncharacterized protein n=1 Tax=Dreissena polymorpha TaxID=45954 RepID=A0A9D4IK86_DREPO|nr:hypothetical protein DPMN_177487 [Dreissena polymorpha]